MNRFPTRICGDFYKFSLLLGVRARTATNKGACPQGLVTRFGSTAPAPSCPSFELSPRSRLRVAGADSHGTKPRMPLRESQPELRTSPLWRFPFCWQLKPFAFLGSRPYHLLSFASPVPSKPVHPQVRILYAFARAFASVSPYFF